MTGCVIFLAAAAGMAFQADPTERTGLPPVLRGVGIDQRLGDQLPLELEFRDEAGTPVRLGDYFQDGKPVVLVLAYYRCPMLCTLVLNGLLESLEAIALDAGDEFQVVAVSFDPSETPELAAAKKAAYTERYGRPGADAGWHFLTGDQPAIDRLTGAVGFRYARDPATGQFAHASGIMVLTPRARLARYFYGVKYPPRDLRLGLVEASGEKIGGVVDRVLLFCYAYDPATGRYTPLARNLVKLAAAATLLALGGYLFMAWRRELRGGAGRAPRPLEHTDGQAGGAR